MADFINDPEAVVDVSRGDNKAVLARMAMPGHLCPFGLKSKSLLERKGFDLTDIRLETRDQTDAFMATHCVETTPQTWINGERIGGHDALRRHFGQHVLEKGEPTYRPILAIFGATALMALIGHSSAWVWLVAPVSLFIGTVGAISVIKAVYIDKRDLTCACVGGNSNVPLGAVSLTENLVMMLMGAWMIGA